MSLIGLDLNSTRARAVRGTPLTAMGLAAAPLLLEETGSALPLALHLDAKVPTVGSYAAARTRLEPHLVCHTFLPHLGQTRQWVVGRHVLDASGALRRVFEVLGARFGATQGAVVALPEYLSANQFQVMTSLVTKPKWPLLGAIPVSLAGAIAMQPRLPWSGPVLVLDVDDYALSCAAVILAPERVGRLTWRAAPTLGTSAWVRRLQECAAQRCIRNTRRDPRDCAVADQSLYLQLLRLIENPPLNDRLISLSLNTPQWSQHLMLPPSELMGFCRPLVMQALQLVRQVHEAILATPQAGPLAGIVLTPMAAGLPGLLTALERLLMPAPQTYSDDLGAGLLDSTSFPPSVHVLDHDDISQMAFSLSPLFADRKIAGSLRETAPVQRPVLEDAGPPRLHFQGRDYQLGGGVFSLGCHPTCNLAFPGDQYPSIADHHCDVLLDRRHYLLRDRSRQGTLVNDRPVRQVLSLHSGDRIRLGMQGPVLQFFGRG